MTGRFSRILKSRNESLAVQSAVLIGARLLGFVSSFAIPIVLVRVYSQADFGVYKQLFLIALTVVPILNLGLTASLFYFVPRDPAEGQRFVVQAIALLSVLGVVAGTALALGAGPISRLMGGPALENYLRILAILVTVMTATDLFIVSLPVVDRRPALAGAVSAFSDLIRAVGIIAAAMIFRSVVAVLWVAIGVAALRAGWLVLYVRSRGVFSGQRANLADLKVQLRYSLPFAAAVVFEVALGRFHEYFVAVRVSPAEFATYAIGVFQVPLLAIIVQSVVEVMLVRTASAAKLRDDRDMRRVWYQVVSFLAVVLIPSWVAAQVWADDLVLSLFGAAYLPAVPIFRVFITVIPLMGLVDHGILRATGDTGYLLKANLAGFVVSVLTIFGLSRFGVFMSAVTGLVAGVMTMRFLGLLKVRVRLGLTVRTVLPWSFFVRVLGASAGAVIVAMPSFWLQAGPVRLMVGGTIFGLVMSAIVWSGWLIDKTELRRALTRIFRSTTIEPSEIPLPVVDLGAVTGEVRAEGAKDGRRDGLLILASIDTEEDNWGRAREGVTCENIRALPAHVDRMAGLGLKLTLFATYRVATLPWAAEILRTIDRGGHEVASQLHPWNTPPESEPFVPRLSMTKNLPPELQAQKVRHVTEAVAEAIGRRPTAFRTGRWGFGPDVAAALVENGYRVDSSVLPFMNWNDVDDGPSFVGAPLDAYRLDGSGDIRVPHPAGPLLEIPASVGFNRTPFDRWHAVYQRLGTAPLKRLRVRSIAVRMGLVRQIMLSPETASLPDMLRVTDCLLEQGVSYLQVYWHSPTIVPGLTPFTATQAEVDLVFSRVEGFLEALDKRYSLRFATVSDAARILAPRS